MERGEIGLLSIWGVLRCAGLRQMWKRYLGSLCCAELMEEAQRYILFLGASAARADGRGAEKHASLEGAAAAEYGFQVS